MGNEPHSPDGQAYLGLARVWFEWPAPATPNAFRTMIEHQGLVAWYTAASARTPRRIVPCFSAATPTRKPGLSTKFTFGRRNVSQRSTKRVILSAAAASIAPA